MTRVTLAQRLLVAIAVLTVATTSALAFGVREAWRRTENEHFHQQFRLAVDQLHEELGAQLRELPELVQPLCEDPLVDSALTGLRGDTLDRFLRTSLSLRLPPLSQALRLDELVLVTSDGEILGAGPMEGLVGKRDPALAQLVLDLTAKRAQAFAGQPLVVRSSCVRRGARGNVWVGLYAARHLERSLSEVARRHRVELELLAEGTPEPKARHSDQMTATMRVPELAGMTLVAAKSRTPLLLALRKLNTTVLGLGGATLAAAMVVAMLLARGLARPIVDLSRQAREVVAGEPKPVEARGGRELEEFAEAFNRTIADLVTLRKRLAATERVAAQREIARRVAHEIKNPLAPIRAAVETLRRLRLRNDPAFDEYFEEATRTVLTEVARISNIVTEFTQFARMPPPRPELSDLGELVRHVVTLHSGTGTTLEVVLGSCPQIRADRDQFVQVATNLVQNAIEAARSSPNPRVWVSLEYADGYAALRVRDNGPGLADEIRKRLFEPYATTKSEGTGLGLSIVERIVVEHGGDVRHERPLEGGAEFIARFPESGPA
jgi:signal transduction histidine kinase